ncbi:MAG: hypothetical protein AAB953_00535, partial [Patescibacteria group bacterium]
PTGWSTPVCGLLTIPMVPPAKSKQILGRFILAYLSCQDMILRFFSENVKSNCPHFRKILRKF